MNAFPRILSRCLSALMLVALLALATSVFLLRAPDVFIEGEVYYIDPDCYSRMLRARELWQKDLHSISFQQTENWPDGVYTHATMPMDVAIVGLAGLSRLFCQDALPIAGALISPLLGLIFITALWLWSWRQKMPNRWMMLLIAAVSPSLAHAFSVGRPDHQSLVLVFVALALMAELKIWSRRVDRTVTASAGGKLDRLVVASGFCWGMALWVSLYEPLILFVLVLLLRLVVLKKAAFHQSFLWGHACTLAVVAVAGFVDGIRVHPLPPETMDYFHRWKDQIGELRGMPLGGSEAFAWTGWLLALVPLLLVWHTVKERSRVSLALLVLLASCYGLTMWQRRWEYFLTLAFVLILPTAMRQIRQPLLRWVLFIISLWPMASQWESLLFPRPSELHSRLENRREAVLLRDAAVRLISPGTTPVLAPWWLCPSIAYWSGQPTVAGSSHQSLPGTIDTARFYLSDNDSDAKEILRKREVDFVFGYEPDRIFSTSSPLIGTAARSTGLANRLFGASADQPLWLSLVYSNPFFRVYEFREPPGS